MATGAASLFLSVTLASGFFLMVTIRSAHAYIELGSVSFMIQMLVASAFGVLFALKVFRHNITGKIGRLIAMLKAAKANGD